MYHFQGEIVEVGRKGKGVDGHGLSRRSGSTTCVTRVLMAIRDRILR